MHLATARQHPAAAVKRQHESDLRTLTGGPGAAERGAASALLPHPRPWLLEGRPAARHPPLVDADVADAAAAVAATLETASRGVIFEHRAETVAASGWPAELRQVLQEAGKGGGSRFEREAAARPAGNCHGRGAGRGEGAGRRGPTSIWSVGCSARALPQRPQRTSPSIILP